MIAERTTRCDFPKASFLSKVYVLQVEPVMPVTMKCNVHDLLWFALLHSFISSFVLSVLDTC